MDEFCLSTVVFTGRAHMCYDDCEGEISKGVAPKFVIASVGRRLSGFYSPVLAGGER